jgi:hypothetical protein
MSLKCCLCEIDDAKVWLPIHGPVCRSQAENGYCKGDGQECPICNQMSTGKLKSLYFFGEGPKVCQTCRNKAWEDIMN